MERVLGKSDCVITKAYIANIVQHPHSNIRILWRNHILKRITEPLKKGIVKQLGANTMDYEHQIPQSNLDPSQTCRTLRPPSGFWNTQFPNYAALLVFLGEEHCPASISNSECSLPGYICYQKYETNDALYKFRIRQ